MNQTQHPAAAGFFIVPPTAGGNPLLATLNFSTNGAIDA
jgi:hypothetical protein